MASLSEIALIVAVTLVVATPWILALVLAVKDIARNPSWFTYLLAGAVVLGSMPVAWVYLAYRAWRGTELTEELNQGSQRKAGDRLGPSSAPLRSIGSTRGGTSSDNTMTLVERATDAD